MENKQIIFNKILIANRGEIAVRIMRSARELGYRTVAVYSDADNMSPHVQMADESVCLGSTNAAESYLNIDKLLSAAKASGADAIHPGYGFLSENADFARACQDVGIVFIGPNSDAIELMGSKRRAKIAMLKADVPCISGYEGVCSQQSDQSDEVLITEALKIGFPLMIKASAGGGGRGMRLVNDESALADAIRSARSESLSAFGCDELILEKALCGARHIEVQIFADQQGNVIHLGERDCSVQRRHQKVIEEAPSPAVSGSLRHRMGQAAIMAAKACDYVGAGTVEFLLDESGEFYFLEMNTRLQVEHPVTELVTGLDLVALQLMVAAGEPLPLTQEQVSITGHAVEVRLYAEDPAADFMPQTGEVLLWQPALTDAFTGQQRADIRVDSGIVEGQRITSFYDPMLAKLIAFGDNREQARRRLIRLVESSHLLGVRDNRAFLTALLKDKTFIQGEATTDFVAEQFTGNASLTAQNVSQEELTLAALLLCGNAQAVFHSSYMGERLLTLALGDSQIKIAVTQLQGGTQPTYSVTNINDGWSQEMSITAIDDQQVRYQYLGVDKTRTFVFEKKPGQSSLWLSSPRGNLQFFDQTLRPVESQEVGGDQVLATMDGVVVDVLVREGDIIKAGDVVAVIEAMKMELPLKASVAGTVEKILVSAGEQVKARQLMVQLARLVS